MTVNFIQGSATRMAVPGSAHTASCPLAAACYAQVATQMENDGSITPGGQLGSSRALSVWVGANGFLQLLEGEGGPST